jgi:hypothetical protein
MKCFYDPTQDAVGTCKSCQRGLSIPYLTELNKGLACKGRCENDATALIALIDRNLVASQTANQIMKRDSGTRYGSSFFLLFIGGYFAISGYSSQHTSFLFYMGLGFVAYGAWNLVRAFRYAKIVSKLPADPGKPE